MSEPLELLLGRIEGKLDAALSKVDDTARDVDEIERRVARLERAKYWLMGLAAGIGAAANKGIEFLTKSP